MDEMFWRFIEDHAGEEPQRLRLKYLTRPADTDFDVALAITQVECRKKYRHKLSGFLGCRTFLFPSSLSGEQSSDEVVARYNAGVVMEGDPRCVADLTAGLGVDAMTVARMSPEVRVRLFEMDKDVASALHHNLKVLGLDNAEVACGDSVERLRGSVEHYDVIFADPARRRTDATGRQLKEQRTYGLADCQPDLTACGDLLCSRCDRLVVKTSPMLDVGKTISDLAGVSEVHVVSLKGECKELLVVCDYLQATEHGSERIVAVDLDGEGDKISVFECLGSELGSSGGVEYGQVEEGMYLYEPSSSVMKTGAWGVLSLRYGLRKVAPNTHIYVGKEWIEDFPGTGARVEKLLSGKELKTLKGERLRVVSRNHPLRADEIEKRYALRSPVYASKTLYALGTSEGPLFVLTE